MMKGGCIFNWERVGAELAQQDDEEQGKFFKSFVRECLSWGTHFQVEKQLAFVNIKLTKDEREVLSMLGCGDDTTQS